MAGCKLTESDVNELQSVEAKILKKSLGLSKYCKTQLLLSALRIKSMEDIIKERKLSFLLQLFDNELTSRVISSLIDNFHTLNKESFIVEMVNNVLGIKLSNFNSCMVKAMLSAHEAYVEDKLNANFETNIYFVIHL